MEIIRIDSVATAFIRPDVGANVGLIHTPKGMVLIDTTSSPGEARSLFEAVGARLDEVQLVINTHSHSDHTWGNQLFTCPILAHRLCQERMRSSLQDEWSPEELQAYIAELEKTDPKRADGLRKTISELNITLPNRVFEDSYTGELGGVKFDVIHLGGHTPDLSVVWLPDNQVLFASDLIFQGRYPYIFDADIPLWIARLDRLLEFQAAGTIPGHGGMCGQVEILALRRYLHDSWELTSQHISQGHDIEEIIADPAYPIYTDKLYERLHQANIRYIYKQIKE